MYHPKGLRPQEISFQNQSSLIMEKKFKPFDRVIARMVHNEEWQCDLYSHQDPITKHHVTVGFAEVKEDNILPYEGNEHLVGTTDEPEERIQVKYWEWIMALSGCLEKPSNEPSDWYLEQFNHISGEENIETKRGCHYCYFIRFSDFNPNDMEETKKHILCVKNGKIVRYKG